MNQLQFFNPYAEIRHTEDRLPHWQQQGAVYFTTFRLADSVPDNLLNEWESERAIWLQFHPAPWSTDVEQEYHKRFSGAMERWLDAGHGACILRRADCAQIVFETLQYFDGKRLALISSAVMPNHVHAIFVQGADYPLEKLMASWKRFTARKINALLHRCGSLWQRDYFDRLVRDDRHFRNCVRYIRRNPQKARLADGEYILYESQLARDVD